jgi:hypothetical protein
VRAIDIASRLGRQKPPQRALEAEFATWSKSHKQRWIRSLKGFTSHLRARMEVLHPEAIGIQPPDAAAPEANAAPAQEIEPVAPMETEAIPLPPDGNTNAPEAQVEPESGLDHDAPEADMDTMNHNVFS